MDLRKFHEALKGAGLPVWHFRARKQAAPYLVWAEDGQGDTVHGDGRTVEQSLTGTVDLFTFTEYDPAFQRVQEVLECAGAAWRLGSIQFEDDTRLFHYEWTWELG